MLEQIPRRHADDPRPYAFRFQFLVGLDAEVHLAAGGHQDDLRLSTFRVGHNVGAASEARRRCVFRAIEGRHGLPRQDERRWFLPQAHDDFPGLDDFVSVCRTQRDQAGNRAQRYQLLDRLMGRSVFADADGIVGEDPDRRNLHDGREADRHLHIVAEDEESRAVGSEFRQRHAVHDCAHGVLANAEMEVARVVMIGLEITRAVEGEPRFRRRIQISGAAHEPGMVLGDCVKNL